MNKLFLLILLLILVVNPVSALEYQAPEAPSSAQQYMPDNTESFSEGLWEILKDAIQQIQPSFADAAKVCFSLIACVILSSILKCFTGITKKTVELVTTFGLSILLIQSTQSMVQLGVNTVCEISEYGKLILPIMTAALAAQGGTATSAALYAGTAFFNTVLTSAITKIMIPMLYILLVLTIAYRAISEKILKDLVAFVKWLLTWCIKISLYLFTGYLSITGVVSGTTDAAALKAAKIAITSAVPFVGNIMSDASESILVGVGVVKGTVGLYGLFVVLAIWIGPFIKIGTQYLLLKITGAVCGMFGSNDGAGLIQDFSGIMGYLVAMTGTICVLILVSVVCFIKGVS